ncbi:MULTISPECIES: EndoU domain-containing protein [unclassified Listeria]|uniref:EndoU domain-containing protein n=1 Tax=unclassified Listeria TaxID=2642072 RepID=UPI000B58F98B|nr:MULTISPECIES: EndoU domain-containing protein [unclassified Listeria]
MESWKTGTYYMDGTLRASAYVESVKGTLDESGLMDVVMGLGLSTTAIRGSMTYEKADVTNIKNNVPDSTLKHVNLGDFNTNNRLINGGHGQSNMDYLKENNIDFNIAKEYLRIGNGQSWFPKAWNDSKIRDAGNHINNLPQNKNLPDNSKQT